MQRNNLWNPRRNPWDPRPARKIKRKRKVTTNKGWANSQKEMRGDQVLLELTGLATGTRGQFVRGVWQYIKANNLQQRYDGRMIVPDETMARLMGTQGQRINAFTMLRHIERHLQRIEDVNVNAANDANDANDANEANEANANNEAA